MTTDKSDQVLFAQVSVRSKGNVSLFDPSVRPLSTNVDKFHSLKKDLKSAVTMLQEAGFFVYPCEGASLSIAGSRKLFQDAFQIEIFESEHTVVTQFLKEKSASYIHVNQPNEQGVVIPKADQFGGILEGLVFNKPVILSAAATAPVVDYLHVRMPGDICTLLKADRVHQEGIKGTGIHVVMIDTGFWPHPYFAGKNYDIQPVVLGPGATSADKDDAGHGTGQSANLLAVAPAIKFTMVKMNLRDPVGAFNLAISLRPNIISCSWGIDSQEATLEGSEVTLAAAVAEAIRNNIVVVAAGGNKGVQNLPAQHPECIAVGGANLKNGAEFEASNFTSAFLSAAYSPRWVPDVSGLAGMLPKAAYLLLPVMPGSKADVELAEVEHPFGDETSSTDGWAAFGGTSAAAPQVAGVCALILQKNKNLSPNQVREILMNTAIPVIRGSSFEGILANDGACGAGLVDAYAAMQLVLNAQDGG